MFVCRLDMSRPGRDCAGGHHSRAAQDKQTACRGPQMGMPWWLDVVASASFCPVLLPRVGPALSSFFVLCFRITSHVCSCSQYLALSQPPFSVATPADLFAVVGTPERLQGLNLDAEVVTALAAMGKGVWPRFCVHSTVSVRVCCCSCDAYIAVLFVLKPLSLCLLCMSLCVCQCIYRAQSWRPRR